MALLTTKLTLSDEERLYLENDLNVTQEEITNIENDNFSIIGDITRLVKILFTCSKNDDAWANIRANIDKIDYNDLFTTCQFVQLDRLATDVYKYLHDNAIIDDTSFRYFEVLSGKLNDWEFWKSQLDGKSTEEKLRFLNESFNGFNPYELGMVSLTKEQTDYIFGDLEDGVKVDFIFNEAPSVNIEPEMLRALIFNNNLQPELAGRYFSILFNIYNSTYDIMDDQYNEFYTEFIKSILEYADNHDIFDRELICDMNIDSLDKFIKFGKLYKEIVEKSDYNDYGSYYTRTFDYLAHYIINSPFGLMYSNTLFGELLEVEVEENDLILSKYLEPKNYSMAITYALNPLIDMSGMIVKNPFPGKYPIIYNKNDSVLFVNGKIYYDFSIEDTDTNPFGFVDDYLITETVDDNIFKNFNSIEDYKEFILICDQFRNQIRE